MEKADIWMPFYVADYLADTMHLTAAEHGGYLMLICHYWKTGPIPDDDARLATISRLGESWAKSASTIKGFFSIQDGYLNHGRIDKERNAAATNKQKKAISGANGARAKWGDSVSEGKIKRSERLANARQLATHSAGEWQALKEIISCCAKCGAVDDLVKDHIKPLYKGGSDGIDNIQPLCRSCNASKGPDSTDYRPTDWSVLLAKRLANAWQMPSPSPSPSSLKEKNIVPSDAGDLFPASEKPAKHDCPHQEIIAIYHEVLPQCPRIRDWTPARAVQLRARWNEDEKRQDLDWWRELFGYVAGCDFLVGKSEKPFFASLEWIVKSANFVKIREGNYENR